MKNWFSKNPPTKKKANGIEEAQAVLDAARKQHEEEMPDLLKADAQRAAEAQELDMVIRKAKRLGIPVPPRSH